MTRAVSVDVIVPHSATVLPGEMVIVETQLAALLKNEAEKAFIHELPSPVPACVCAT